MASLAAHPRQVPNGPPLACILYSTHDARPKTLGLQWTAALVFDRSTARGYHTSDGPYAGRPWKLAVLVW